MSIESQFESFRKEWTAYKEESLQRLTRVETNHAHFTDWIEKHEIDAANGFKRIGDLEASVQRVRGGMWVVSTLGIGSIIVWLKTKLGL